MTRSHSHLYVDYSNPRCISQLHVLGGKRVVQLDTTRYVEGHLGEAGDSFSSRPNAKVNSFSPRTLTNLGPV
jgi:hypothetical protein